MTSSSEKPQEGNSFEIRYLKGDLFSCPEKDALAHCISEDCEMEAGIAVLFKKKYGCVDELRNQKKKIGEAAVLQKDQRYIYYLITKKVASDKPIYDDLQSSLKAMKNHCLSNGVLQISMPKIGCGLDNLEWDKVSAIIQEGKTSAVECFDLAEQVFSTKDRKQLWDPIGKDCKRKGIMIWFADLLHDIM